MREERCLLHTDAAGEGHRIDFAAGRPHILTVALTVLWFAGWLLLLVLTALEHLRFGRSNLLGIVLLVVGGPPVGLALLWAASGKRESLVVTPSELRIFRWAGPFRLVRSISASTVIDLHAATVPGGFRSDFMAVRQFYSGGCGALAIETTGRLFSVGHTLSAEAASQLIQQIRRSLPQLSMRPAGAAIPRRRTIDYVAGFMTVTLIGFAFNVPARLAITDRPICFYDDTVVPRQPIDVSRIRPAGRVHLVPIADFPPDRAAAIAEHFRREFGVAIDVAPVMEWPEGAYVERRRQMNSAMMLTRLESAYATTGEPVVAIGLTTRDMFNPDVNWAYVFSYRRKNRVAVVSPARMDRGCMGVFQADDDRIMARLRKMVGKNIGIMYFGLQMSADPASMLYANIGGPQELDAMSELF
jgi:predicted Zn-dependent protease